MSGSKAVVLMLLVAGLLMKQARCNSMYVEGYVYCQDCSGEWTRPLKHALVGLSCKKKRERAVYSDDRGFFHIQIPSVQPQNCFTYPISSSDASCKIPVRIDNSKLVFSKPSLGGQFYITGPFAFTPSACLNLH